MDETPPDWDNPPCPACFAFNQKEAECPPTVTCEEHVAEVRTAFATGMAAGYLHCRMQSGPWQHLCQTHLEAMQSVIDSMCATIGLPRDEVYKDFGIPMPADVLQ